MTTTHRALQVENWILSRHSMSQVTFSHFSETKIVSEVNVIDIKWRSCMDLRLCLFFSIRNVQIIAKQKKNGQKRDRKKRRPGLTILGNRFAEHLPRYPTNGWAAKEPRREKKKIHFASSIFNLAPRQWLKKGSRCEYFSSIEQYPLKMYERILIINLFLWHSRCGPPSQPSQREMSSLFQHSFALRSSPFIS